MDGHRNSEYSTHPSGEHPPPSTLPPDSLGCWSTLLSCPLISQASNTSSDSSGLSRWNARKSLGCTRRSSPANHIHLTPVSSATLTTHSLAIPPTRKQVPSKPSIVSSTRMPNKTTVKPVLDMREPLSRECVGSSPSHPIATLCSTPLSFPALCCF